MCENWRSTLPTFDASSIIHAWDHYPLKQFPRLWEWLGDEFNAQRFTMPEIAEGETKKRDVDCHKWLRQNNVRIIPMSPEILSKALEIKASLGIVHDRDYATNGVGENDILIVATCVTQVLELVSNEGVQRELPRNLRKYKIPAVCRMVGVNVPCISFRELLVQSGKVF